MISRGKPSMRIVSLQSGSNGNCIYVETPSTRLLFDAGISGARAKERLAQHGIDIRDVDALLVTHDHWDHATNMGVFHRKFNIPVWVTGITYKTVLRKKPPGHIANLNPFVSGETFRIGDATIETIRTPHDAADGVAFIIDDGRVRFGIMTDLGHATADLREAVRSLDAVLLESNYDPESLQNCTYSGETKARISGKGGHLSNFDAARLLEAARSRLQWACLGHISQESNTHQLVLETHRRILRNSLSFGITLPLYIASRYGMSEMFEL